MKRFPILDDGDDCPSSVPWPSVEPARSRAMKTHDQTLERLAERGGLSPVELCGALDGLNWGQLNQLNHEDCVARLKVMNE